MKSILTLVFGCLFLNVFSQQLLPIQHDTTNYSHEFFMHGMADYGATSLENDLTKKLIFGGNITNEIKENSFSRHRGINRAGIDATGEIEYRNFKTNFFKKENWGLVIKGGYYNYAAALYSKDLFGLTFYGNENYLGENIQFSGSRFLAMSFQKVGFGWIDKKTKSNISLNFYTISNYSEGVIFDGQLFQSNSGDSVSLTLDGSFESATGNNFIKGLGVGIDLDFRIPVILNKERVSYIQFIAKNVGISRLNSPVKRYSADTTFIFDGLTFEQLYGNSTVFREDFSILDSLGVDARTIKKTRFLPGFIQVGKIVDEMNPARIQSFFGIRMYPSIAYVPMIYAGAQFKTTSWLDLGTNLSFGGYTKFKFGMYAQVKYKSFGLGVATEDVFGMVSSSGKGKSLIVRLRLKV